MGNLPAILQLQKYLVEKFTGRIALSDVEDMKIREFYDKVDEDHQLIQLSEVLFHRIPLGCSCLMTTTLSEATLPTIFEGRATG